MQDPFERADITSNTFWDWLINHVGSVYGDDGRSLQVCGDIQGLPAALLPAELHPANIMESTLDNMKQKKALTEGLDLERIRGNLNKMIDQQLQQRGVK